MHARATVTPALSLSTLFSISFAYITKTLSIVESAEAMPSDALLRLIHGRNRHAARRPRNATQVSLTLTRNNPSVRRAAAFWGLGNHSRSLTLNTLRNHGESRLHCGITRSTSRTFHDVCGETCPGPGTLAVCLRTKTPAASSLKNTYRRRTRTPYASLAIDAGARTSRGGRSVMGSDQRGSWGRWEVGTSTLKGWVDLRLGRRRGTGARKEEVDWMGCFP